MRAAVVIATKGRARETATLLDMLARQTFAAERVVVVGAEAGDVAGLERHALAGDGRARIVLSPRAGLPIQRNVGLEALAEDGFLEVTRGPSFVAFFDDDFRPAEDWLACAGSTFAARSEVAGLTGRVLADGVKGTGLSETDARAFLAGERAPEPHWASGASSTTFASMYGCNMAFRDDVVRACRFDECLPLYAWQEDRDYTSQAASFGLTVYEPSCRGVHLGVKAGRTSGLRFGYSQIANPLYLAGKGTMKHQHAAHFIARAVVANCLKSLGSDPVFDYRGRLAGNLHAIADLCTGRCHPARILNI